MFIGLLLYEDDVVMHIVHAYLLLYLQVVHFTVLFGSSVCVTTFVRCHVYR